MNYNKEEVPVLSQTPVQLNISFYLRSIVDLDDRNEVFTVNGFFKISWCDYRLAWDFSSFMNTSHTFLPRSKVWIPDLTLDNTITEYQVLGQEKDILRVDYDGCVLWFPGNIYRAKCDLDITYFPFDQQKCNMKIYSWIYRNHETQIGALQVQTFPDKWNIHGEWKVEDISSAVLVGELSKFTVGFEVKFYLKRRYTFYIFNIIVPLALTCILNILVFILRTDTSEKITLTSTVFISYFVFLGYISDNIPNTSQSISILGVLISVQLRICAISVVLSVCIRKSPRETS